VKRIKISGPIGALYDEIKQKITISVFEEALERFWNYEYAHRQYLDDIRLSREPCKKLMDEVMPVSGFLKFHGIDTGLIRFPLDCHAPDCWLWEFDGASPRQIEVTVTLAEDRFRDASEIIKKGEIHRIYTTEEKLLETVVGIQKRRTRKNQTKYHGMDLLISGPLSVRYLPLERWQQIQPALVDAAQPLPFRQIHLMGDTDKPISFRIK
jgi:hypothetical protein